MEKQRIHVVTIDVARDDLFGEISNVISFLAKIRDKYKNGEYVEVVEDWYGYEDNFFQIRVHREETDKECLKREDEENKAFLKEKEKQNKLKEERLKKEEIKKQIEKLQKQL